ncbi:hypothetical protein D9Q98_003434 [Chlorella vulgaris]|uniref:WW domain-containing protein n=1 Tax=Chlorella vulgaris TaxID=3077 RepID=A0A9D4YZF4_CHLVU|nr:hypothetical protein D9Q98_003434 [Chlorella vulgaris]
MARRQLQSAAEHMLLVTRGLAGRAGSGRPRPATHATPSTKAQAAPAATRGPLVPTRSGSSEWTEVVHQQSGQTYYWNESTGETTAVGEPRPGPEGRLSTRPASPFTAPQQARSAASGLGQLVAMGAGVGLVFALLSRVF